MKFTVPGKPYGKARPRTNSFHVYNPKKNVEYERRVRKAYLQAKGMIEEPTNRPIWIDITCYYAIPKAIPKKQREMMLNGKILPVIRPDLDNCMKSIMDALNGLAFVDDKQIVYIKCSKKYSDEPRTEVNIGRYSHDL